MTGWVVVCLLAATVLSLTGCDSTVKRKPRASRPERLITRDTPSVLRDTIGSQATLSGMNQILVSGYGLVVGLNGTGSGDVPGPVRAVMEREMLVMGVGKEIGAFRNMTPDDILNDRNTAVVLVSAAVPPGSPVGTRFDVRVDVLPGSAATSLEGGRLYTTRLFQGLIRPAAPATEPLAEAKGELFLNPFADPAKAGADSALRIAGRVLNGGMVTRPQPIMLSLDAPSHTRARAMAESINFRFPRARGDVATARGLNEESVEISIPAAYRDDPEEFLNLLMRVRVDQTFPEESALRYVRALKEQPELSEELAWCIQALGPVAIPHVRELYTYPDDRPRLAAITSGAKLGDMTTRPYLEDLAISGPPGMRTRALALMSHLGPDPKINTFLRDQLDATELDMRLAAYEGLAHRRDTWVERRSAGGKFVMDLVPSAEPMVYVTMQRQPRVVLFGDRMALRRPVFVSVWDDRLMLSADNESQPVRVFYRDYRSGHSKSGEVPPIMAELIEYMAHKTTPEEPAPGLDLNYSEVVGALATMLRKGASAATFVPESDRLELELIRLRQDAGGYERPEVAPEEDKDLFTERPESIDRDPLIKVETDEEEASDRPEGEDAAEVVPPASRKKKYVVPLGPPPGAATPPPAKSPK